MTWQELRGGLEWPSPYTNDLIGGIRHMSYKANKIKSSGTKKEE